jgi:hypothetical protein
VDDVEGIVFFLDVVDVDVDVVVFFCVCCIICVCIVVLFDEEMNDAFVLDFV